MTTADGFTPRPTHRVYAELTSGERLVPGVSATCPGPDAYGACPLAGNGVTLPCAGATWCYDGQQSWRFVFRADAGVCPAVLLDPLGPLPTPGD
jgi:hypothetical protein